MAQTTEVLELLLTARYVGGPAFNSLARDIDTLVNSTSGLAKAGAGLSLVGTMATAAGVAVASFAVESIKQYDQYNAAVNRLVAVHALGTNQVQQFNQAVMQTSNQFGQNSTDIANGLYVIMSGMKALGYTANDIFKYNIINSLGAFVAASGNGLPGSVGWDKAATDVIHIGSAFNLPMSQWPTMMGQMTMTENTSGITQNNLVQAVLRASSTANEVGLNPAELFATIGAMGTAGVFGPRAGTELASGLRMMLSNKTSLKALGSIGLSANQFWGKNGQLIDPGSMLGLIYSHLSTLSPQQRFATESKIFGAVGNRALGQLMNKNALATYGNIMKAEVHNPVGDMFGVAGQQLNNFNGAVMRLHQAVLNFMKAVGGPLAQAIQPLISHLADLLTRLDNFLLTPAGQKMLTHAPQAIFGAAAGLLTAGPAMQMGGGWLRDFALKHDTAYAKSLERLTQYNERGAIGRTLLEQQIGGQRQNLAERLALAMTGGGGGGSVGKTVEQQMADLLKPRSVYWNTLGDQRMQYLLPYLSHTKAGAISARGLDPLLQKAVQDATNATGPGAGFARRRAWDYVNAHWDTIAKTYGVDAANAPSASDLLSSMVKQPGSAKNHEAALKRLEMQKSHFERNAALRLEQYDARLKAGSPKLEKSAGQLLEHHARGILGHVWGFGQALSPWRIGGALFHEGKRRTDNAMSAFIMHRVGGGSLLGGIGKGAAQLVAPEWAKISGVFGKIVGFVKNIGPAIKAGIAAIPSILTGIASAGSALLPIIAIVLLIAGAIVIGVLAFTRYRAQVMGVVAVFQSAFAPVFQMVMGVVKSTLKEVQQAWAAHSKEIDKAMKGLMTALSQSAPFFVLIGTVIGAIIVVIVRVIGYLVKAFISALPSIINFFSYVFRFLGDLGNIVMAVVHGKWGLAWDFAKKALKDAWGAIKSLLSALWTFISQVFVNLWKDIGPTLKGLWTNITNWFSGLGKGIQTAFTNALSGMGNAIKNAVMGAIRWALQNMPGGMVTRSVFNALGLGQFIGQHASGGYIDHPMLSWVGEKGPELVKLPGGSRVYNHLDSVNMFRDAAQQENPSNEARSQRSTAEEYFFARAVQHEREGVWDRYPNTSREFDHTYRRAYQYYG